MPHGSQTWGTRTEIKNLNSFRSVQRALEYERARQVQVVKSGGRVAFETMLWDESAQRTAPQRSKERAHDYRYFPEPDLPPLQVSEEWIESVRREMPELPPARRRRFVTHYGLPAYDAAVLTSEKALADLYEEVIRFYDNPKSVSNWMMGEVMREAKARAVPIAALEARPEHLAELIRLVEDGEITGLTAKGLLTRILDTGKAPSALIRQQDLSQESDERKLRHWIEEAMKENPRAVEDYNSGKKTAAQFIIGSVMQKSRGRANPRILASLVEKMLLHPERRR
jgi:aspartyl-tRNA(Asn)/glutamyl-tRNA(Gln) amidotransferase subunit B